LRKKISPSGLRPIELQSKSSPHRSHWSRIAAQWSTNSHWCPANTPADHPCRAAFRQPA